MHGVRSVCENVCVCVCDDMFWTYTHSVGALLCKDCEHCVLSVQLYVLS